MTNTHRRTTIGTTAKIAAVGAFGIGAAVALPGLAAAQDTTPSGPTASLESATGEDGSLSGTLGTALELDLGSLALDLGLDAQAPDTGSLESGSLSSDTGSGSTGDDDEDTGDETDGDAADTGSLGSLGSASDGDETTDEGADTSDPSGAIDLGSLAALSSGTGDDADPSGDTTDDTATDTGAGATTGSLG